MLVCVNVVPGASLAQRVPCLRRWLNQVCLVLPRSPSPQNPACFFFELLADFTAIGAPTRLAGWPSRLLSLARKCGFSMLTLALLIRYNCAS